MNSEAVKHFRICISYDDPELLMQAKDEIEELSEGYSVRVLEELSAPSQDREMLKEAAKLLEQLNKSREMALYIDHSSTYGKNVSDWLARNAKSQGEDGNASSSE